MGGTDDSQWAPGNESRSPSRRGPTGATTSTPVVSSPPEEIPVPNSPGGNGCNKAAPTENGVKTSDDKAGEQAAAKPPPETTKKLLPHQRRFPPAVAPAEDKPSASTVGNTNSKPGSAIDEMKLPKEDEKVVEKPEPPQARVLPHLRRPPQVPSPLKSPLAPNQLENSGTDHGSIDDALKKQEEKDQMESKTKSRPVHELWIPPHRRGLPSANIFQSSGIAQDKIQEENFPTKPGSSTTKATNVTDTAKASVKVEEAPTSNNVNVPGDSTRDQVGTNSVPVAEPADASKMPSTTPLPPTLSVYSHTPAPLPASDPSYKSLAMSHTPLNFKDSDSMIQSTAHDDIRAEMDLPPRPPEPEQDWNAVRQPRGRRRKQNFTPAMKPETSPPLPENPKGVELLSSPLHRYIELWSQAVPTMQTVFLQDNVKGHENCDIDPKTGLLLSPIAAPACIQTKPVEDYMYQFKYISMSATDTLATWKPRYRGQAKERKMRAQRQHLQELLTARQRANPFTCRVEAHLRPAIPSDMDDVARIFGEEAKSGWRTTGLGDLQSRQWNKILKDSKANRIPFVVALTGFRDPQSPQSNGHQLIGFAFIDPIRGISGCLDPDQQHGKIYVFVTPEHRRQRLGTALFDSVLRCTSLAYMTRDPSYQFIYDEDSTYQIAFHSPRKWRTLTAEVYVKSLGTKETTRNGEEFQHVYNWLEADLNFYLRAHSIRFGTHPDTRGLDRLIFEHQCINVDGPSAF